MKKMNDSTQGYRHSTEVDMFVIRDADEVQAEFVQQLRAITGTRVEHRVSGQIGTRTSEGIWYSAVRFDGEDCTSWVANESVRELP
jgi:hypothetical protein